MKDKLTPFELALLDASLEEFDHIPQEDEIEAEFSPQFLQKSSNLLQSAERKTWRYTNTFLKKVVLVAIIIFLLATTGMAVPAIREAIIGYFFQDKGTHFEFAFDPEQAATAPDFICDAYLPTYIPEEFYISEDGTDLSVAGGMTTWINGTGAVICFNQMVIPENPTFGDWYGVNSEHTTTETIEINGYEVFCLHDDDGTVTYIWTNNEYFFNLSCRAGIADEIDRIFTASK